MNSKLARILGVICSLGFASLASAIPFGTSLSENTTGVADSFFLGAPDGTTFSTGGTGGPDTSWIGIGGADVTYDFGSDRVINGAGVDFVVYEVNIGVPEFGLIDVLLSLDGLSFTSVAASATTGVNILGDGGEGSGAFARGYDIGAFGSEAQFIRIDGLGSGGPSGCCNAFDLDAIGLVNFKVPVPPTLALLGLGLVGLAYQRRKQDKKI